MNYNCIYKAPNTTLQLDHSVAENWLKTSSKTMAPLLSNKWLSERRMWRSQAPYERQWRNRNISRHHTTTSTRQQCEILLPTVLPILDILTLLTTKNRGFPRFNNGGNDWDWTSEPCNVNAVLSLDCFAIRWEILVINQSVTGNNSNIWRQQILP